MASLSMANAVIGAAVVKANWTNVGDKVSGQPYSQITTTVNYGSYSVYSVLANKVVPLTVASTADTADAIFTGNLNLSTGGVYSLFLAGYTGAIDTVLIQESIPRYVDSSCGVRFINLVYNGNPVFIQRTNMPGIADFPSMSYKQYSGFKQYAADITNGSYSFQVVDNTTNKVLASYNLSTPFFQNVTLAWVGQSGGTGTNAPKIVRINNY